MIYHFPCDVTFATQQTGFGSCPDRITIHVPLFTKQTFHYVPWTHHSKDILDLHYKSLNISPPLQFHNSTLQSLDRTFHLLDGQLATQLHTLKQDIPKLHAVNETHTNDILTYVAFILALINSMIIFIFCCFCRKLMHGQKSPVFHCIMRPKTLASRKQQCSKRPNDSQFQEPAIELADVQFSHSSQNEQAHASEVCSTCQKPFVQRNSDASCE